MADFDFSGIEELERLLGSIGAIPQEVLGEMLDSMADIVITEQQKTAPKDTGSLAGSLKAVRKMGKDGPYILVYPHGNHHKYRRRLSVKTYKNSKSGRMYTVGGNMKAVTNAEVGFIHEVGAPGKNIPASQWMKRANEKAADPALRAAVQVYDNWLKLLEEG